jgi:hypothetical protein
MHGCMRAQPAELKRARAGGAIIYDSRSMVGGRGGGHRGRARTHAHARAQSSSPSSRRPSPQTATRRRRRGRGSARRTRGRWGVCWLFVYQLTLFSGSSWLDCFVVVVGFWFVCLKSYRSPAQFFQLVVCWLQPIGCLVCGWEREAHTWQVGCLLVVCWLLGWLAWDRGASS